MVLPKKDCRKGGRLVCRSFCIDSQNLLSIEDE